VGKRQAAELPAELLDEPESDEDDEVEELDFAEESDDFDDDAGLLLDEEPRLSLR
jgi:hypothetical protein